MVLGERQFTAARKRAEKNEKGETGDELIGNSEHREKSNFARCGQRLSD